MKTVFAIPQAGDGNEPQHLLAEVGSENMSLLIFTKSPFTIAGLWIYEIDQTNCAAQQAEAIKETLSESPFNESFSSVTILYNVNETTLVPKNYHQPMMKSEVLALLYGNNKLANVFDETITDRDIVNIFRVDKTLVETLRDRFPFASVHHSNTKLLQELKTSGDELYCIIGQKQVRVVLQKNGVLQLAQQFYYQSATDVAYHLLNVCQQHDISATEVSLLLSGMIDESSNLYRELYKYFAEISFAELPAETQVSEGFEAHPKHFFQHLILLASCV